MGVLARDRRRRPRAGRAAAWRGVAIAALTAATVAAVSTLQEASEPPPAAPPAVAAVRTAAREAAQLLPVSLRGITIGVLNAYGGTGAAARAAAELRRLGLRIGEVANGTYTLQPTHIAYQWGHRRAARELAARLHLPAPSLLVPGFEPSGTSAPVVVLVGSDGLPPRMLPARRHA